MENPHDRIKHHFQQHQGNKSWDSQINQIGNLRHLINF